VSKKKRKLKAEKQRF